MNNKGNLNAVAIIFFAIVGIMLFAFAGGIFSVITNNFIGEVQPIIGGLGDTGVANFSEVNQMTFIPLQRTTQTFNWLFGVLLAVGLLSTFILAVSYRFTGNQWIIPVFIIVGILVVLISILISNSYESFLVGNDIVATGLKEQEVLSFLLVYAPIISTIVFFIAGIIMFTGSGDEVIA